MTLNNIQTLTSLVQAGDILLINTKDSFLADIIQQYEKDTNRDKFYIYADHIVQVYDDKFCIDQHFPFAKFSNYAEKYFSFEHEIVLIRPNLSDKELLLCKQLMLSDVGTFYGVLQIVGFAFYYISSKLFKKKIRNFLALKSVEVCSLSVFRRLIAIHSRFNIAEEEWQSDEGLITPQDFLRACAVNANFKIIHRTTNFSFWL